MNIQSNKFSLMGSVDQLQKSKVLMRPEVINNQTVKKSTITHDPSEISDSESQKSASDDLKKLRSKQAGDMKSAKTLAKSEVIKMSKVKSETAPKQSSMFFSMSEFFSQVKKTIWDGSSGAAPTQQELIVEEEDNGEISPDSIDPELEHSGLEGNMESIEQISPVIDEPEGINVQGQTWKLRPKTKRVQPGVQSKTEMMIDLEKKNTAGGESLSFVSPRQIPQWSVLGGAISDKD